MKKNIIMTAAMVLAMIPAAASAQIAVGIIPFEGNDPVKTEFEKNFTQNLVRGGQLQAVSEKSMKEIMKIQENAQLMGSAYHDISKMKLAEYIINGETDGTSLTINAADVNTSAVVFTKTVPFDAKKKDYLYRSLAAECRDALIMGSSGKERDAPDEAKEYLAVLGSLVKSLGSGDEASYPFIAVYRNGSYVHPSPEIKGSEDKAKQFLKYFRPYFVRSKITFISIEKHSGNVLITCIADKAGSKTKHIVGFVELDDGSIALLDELHKLLQ